MAHRFAHTSVQAGDVVIVLGAELLKSVKDLEHRTAELLAARIAFTVK